MTTSPTPDSPFAPESASPARVPDNIEVRPARFGQGVFAIRDLEDDEVVGRIRGLVTPEEDVDPDYCIQLEGDLYLIPAPPFRFLNHSCEPNCELFIYEHDPESEEIGYHPLYVATLREIAEGEELTIDYAWSADHAIPCGCGAPGCRGWIVAEEERHELGDPPVSGASSDQEPRRESGLSP